MLYIVNSFSFTSILESQCSTQHNISGKETVLYLQLFFTQKAHILYIHYNMSGTESFVAHELYLNEHFCEKKKV